MKKFVMLSGLAFLLTGIASADIIVSLNSGPVVNGSNFDWTYTATLKSGATLNSGDFFTIYDIGGFGPSTPIAGNVIMPATLWSSSIQFLGTNGFGQSPVDSGSIYNVTYTYTGTAVNAVSDTVLGGGAGAFGYTSSNNTSFTGAFSATSHLTSNGSTLGNTGTVTVAGASPVPEPSTTFLFGGGLIALFFVLRRVRTA